MKYVHYWHFNKNWYARINDNPKPERICGGREDNYVIYDCWEQYFVEGSAFLTRREVKQKLTELYPGLALVKDIPYHEGARWFGNKCGSRS